MLVIAKATTKFSPFLMTKAIIVIITVYVAQVATRYVSSPVDYDYDDDENDEYIKVIMEKNMAINDMEKLIDAETRFTYGEEDLFGPLRWRDKNTVSKLLISKMNHGKNLTPSFSSKLEKLYEDNHCKINWLSPINIETRRVQTPEEMDVDEEENQDILVIPETLIISILIPNVQYTTWIFGHPTRYHGIQIHPNEFSIIQLKDNVDDPFLSSDDENSFTTYDFHFLTLFYCDIRKSLPHRTMHQIDGKRFPLELAFVFLRKMEEKEKTFLNYEVDYSADDDEDDDDKEAEIRATLYDGEYIAVIVSVLGEVGGAGAKDNIYFQPVVEAAKKFTGEDYNYTNVNFAKKIVTVQNPWSPTWLLPDSSKYYYYDGGNFPVPPCWSVARYYIMRDRIIISQAQMDALTHIRSNREKNSRKRLPCTHAISSGFNSTHRLVSSIKSVNFNLIEYEMRGEDDGKPLSENELKVRNERKAKQSIFRKHLVGDEQHSSSRSSEKMQTALLTLTHFLSLYFLFYHFKLFVLN